MAKEIKIKYAYEGFFDGCDAMDGVDQDATINAWESLVREKVEAAYPDADVEIDQIRSGFGRVYVDDQADSNDASNVKGIMNDAFANESIWIIA